MILDILGWMFGLYLINACSEALFGWAPLQALAAARARRRPLAPTERERLLQLEEAEADRAILAAEGGGTKPRRRGRSR